MAGAPGPIGYDPNFLGVTVALPLPTSPDVVTAVLTYTHFSVVMRPDRRLAAATAVGIDGATVFDIKRTNVPWRLDPRLPETAQAGAGLYEDNSLDRGHLVRRTDPVWGSAVEAAQANIDTFHFTNAAPQQAAFNQGKQLWAGLEDYLLENAAAYDRKLVVLTGPVLDPGDPLYRGVLVPLRFWKVAAFLADGKLASTAYVLDQSPPDPAQLRRLIAAGELTEAPPLGPYRTFQVPVRAVADLTGLDLGPLPKADRLPDSGGRAEARTREPWKLLATFDDIRY